MEDILNNNVDNKVEVQEGQEQQNNEPKTYTQEEVNELLKNYVSKEDMNNTIQTRLTKAKNKWKEEQSKAEILANETQEEKTNRELEELKAEIKSLKAEKTSNDLKSTSTKILKEEYGLDIETATAIANNINYGDLDVETIKTQLKVFGELYSNGVKANSQKKIESLVEDTTKINSNNENANTGLTNKDFKKMSYKERVELMQKDKATYDRISK